MNDKENLYSLFVDRARAEPEKILYSQFLRADSHDQSYRLIKRSYSEVLKRVSAIAQYLNDCGVKAGDSVGIISATRPEWLEADFAIMSLGGVTVSFYPSLLESEIAYILFDSNCQVVFVENLEQFKKLQNLSNLRHQIPASADRPACEYQVSLKAVITFEEIPEQKDTAYFPAIIEQNSAAPVGEVPKCNADTLASLVYTSGTTGPQKGVMQSHANHSANVRQAKTGGLYRDDSAIFLMLPLAHSFAKLMGFIGFVAGVHLQFPSISDSRSSKANQRRVLMDLSQSSCGVIPLVPRILEKMKEGIEAQANRPDLKGFLLRLTLKAAHGKGSSSRLRIGQSFLHFLTRPIRNSIKRKLFGENFQYVISGGAKLPVEVNQFFANLGIEVLEGYGLTETCVATNCNRPGQNRIGTVGPSLSPDIEIKLNQEDGEILFRGPNVAKGYLNQPTATAKSWDSEGWFHTGDLGSLSSDGYLSIVGRKKEILVTAGGKKIGPDRIEEMFRAHELVSHVCLLGEGMPYCVALVTLNCELSLDSENLKSLWARLEQHLQFVNQKLASFETIKKICIVREDFSVENGCLTPTLKMRRSKIMEKYKVQFERLYSSTETILLE